MPKKNQSKSDKKVLPLNNQKKPLPKPDPTLIQIAHKVHEKPGVVKGHKDTGVVRPKDTGGVKKHK